jgi:glutathione peroxidase
VPDPTGKFSLTNGTFDFPVSKTNKASFKTRFNERQSHSAVDNGFPLLTLRGMKILALVAAFLTALLVQAALAPVYSLRMKSLDGKPFSLQDYKGKVVLLVNVASKCGYTPQYKGLQALQEKYHAKGFTVVGVPCNDFGSQEPGSSEEIRKFCTDNYKVTFPLTEKVHVKGPEQHPLYARLTGKEAEFPGDIKWNFGKFLIGRDGKILKRFDSGTTPESPELTSAIESALAAK